MNFNYKLYFKYILFTTNTLFFKYLLKNNKNTNIFILPQHLYYLILHLKLSSVFYSSQLIDIFSYEIPVNFNKLNNKNKNYANLNTTIVTYNFHIINNQQRILIFILNNETNLLNKKNLNSITELFSNAN